MDHLWLGLRESRFAKLCSAVRHRTFGRRGQLLQWFLAGCFSANAFAIQGQPVLDLLPPEELAHSQRRAIDTIQELNIEHRASREGFTDLDARIASYELAYRMQASALEVGDLDAETAATRAAYGFEHKDAPAVSFARKCLLARRLVERGVRFVQLYDMPDKDGWDAHSGLVQTNHREPRALDRSTCRRAAGGFEPAGLAG